MKKQLMLRKKTIANFEETSRNGQNGKISSIPCGVIIETAITTIKTISTTGDF
jgi:hypothetical protein